MGGRKVAKCKGSSCYRSTGRGVHRTYGYPRTSVCFLIKKARAGRAMVSSMLRDCRKIVTTRAKRITSRRTNTVRTSNRGMLALPRRRKGVRPGSITSYLGRFCDSKGRRRVIFPKVICVSRPARCNALCAHKRLTRLSSVYRRCRVPLCLSKTHLKCNLTMRSASIAVRSVTRCYSVFCVNKAGMNTFYKRTIMFAGRGTPERFIALVGRRKTLLTGK